MASCGWLGVQMTSTSHLCTAQKTTSQPVVPFTQRWLFQWERMATTGQSHGVFLCLAPGNQPRALWESRISGLNHRHRGDKNTGNTVEREKGERPTAYMEEMERMLRMRGRSKGRWDRQSKPGENIAPEPNLTPNIVNTQSWTRPAKKQWGECAIWDVVCN